MMETGKRLNVKGERCLEKVPVFFLDSWLLIPGSFVSGLISHISRLS